MAKRRMTGHSEGSSAKNCLPGWCWQKHEALGFMNRCGWAREDFMIAYHDEEWGVPVHDDRALFELLILEGAQAGLSWSTILKKRSAYRAAFNRFDPRKV